jgi:hypothetical protein
MGWFGLLRSRSPVREAIAERRPGLPVPKSRRVSALQERSRASIATSRARAPNALRRQVQSCCPWPGTRVQRSWQAVREGRFLESLFPWAESCSGSNARKPSRRLSAARVSARGQEALGPKGRRRRLQAAACRLPSSSRQKLPRRQRRASAYEAPPRRRRPPAKPGVLHPWVARRG